MRFSLFSVLSGLAALAVVSAMPTEKLKADLRLAEVPSDNLQARAPLRKLSGKSDIEFDNELVLIDVSLRMTVLTKATTCKPVLPGASTSLRMTVLTKATTCKPVLPCASYPSLRMTVLTKATTCKPVLPGASTSLRMTVLTNQAL
ncbi:hypothetical protein EV363DRAFT_1321746 [Boletus edulis]|nr:hypothetical protein EV363DRAFT_1321746 [Boletus edulis]